MQVKDNRKYDVAAGREIIMCLTDIVEAESKPDDLADYRNNEIEAMRRGEE